MIKVAINGFGRIGRNFLRCIMLDADALKKIQISVINIGPAKLDYVAHMFKYDSLMGIYQGDVRMDGNQLIIDGHHIAIVTESDPAKLIWTDIDWVVDCSGRFTKRDTALQHIKSGAQHVLISAPAHDEDVTIIPGVNDDAYDAAKHQIVSLGSCTTNALLPMLKVIHDAFTIEHALMTTVHAYTNSQVLLDVEAKDIRESRAAGLNIIPTTTGAMKVVGKVMPQLQGKIEGVSIRVPVAKVSLVDLVFTTQKNIDRTTINQAFADAAYGSMKHILGITVEPLVSSDFSGNNHSVIIDSLLTTTSGDRMGKAFGWYDNEWGYSMRLKDFLIRNT